jgi:glutamyl-tRNA reductase
MQRPWITVSTFNRFCKYFICKMDCICIVCLMFNGNEKKGNTVSTVYSVSSCFQIRIWNHKYEGAQTLTKELTAKGKNAVAYHSVEECVQDADVIVTATFASSPILKGKWIKPGAHINGMCT